MKTTLRVGNEVLPEVLATASGHHRTQAQLGLPYQTFTIMQSRTNTPTRHKYINLIIIETLHSKLQRKYKHCSITVGLRLLEACGTILIAQFPLA